VVQPKVGGNISTIYGNLFEAPALYFTLTNLLSTIDPYQPIRVMGYVTSWNGANAYDGLMFGFVDTTTKTDLNIWCGICCRPARNVWSGINIIGSNQLDAGQALPTDNIFCLTMPNGVCGQTIIFSSGIYSVWPPQSQLITRWYNVIPNGLQSGRRSIANYAAMIACGSGGGGTSGLSATVRNFRVEVM
jgi:hypothetical protein